jgi:protein-S-isoprenylcysteine O-methyltransferase Ste14
VARADLTRSVLVAMVRFALVLAVMIFAPAWSLAYWQGWTLWFIFIASCLAITFYLMRRDPALVERRMRSGPSAERESGQKWIMTFASILFFPIVMLPALDHRFGWSLVPACVVIGGDCLVILGFALVTRVLRENSFASAIIEVSGDQKVVSTGPYAIVRHPMYAGALPLLFGIPLALGSFWGLAPAALLLAVIIWRLLDEERYLTRHLAGYEDYCRRVRWRLAPGVW